MTWADVVLGRRRPLTVVMKYSDKEWDEAFDEIAQGRASRLCLPRAT
ncbi:hypothetical protein [Nonomuraea sp. NPDC005692]